MKTTNNALMKPKYQNTAPTGQGQATDELSHLPTHATDRDSEGLDRDIALEANRERILEAVNSAWERLNGGRDGICEDCGAEIPKSRLDALPFAVRCVACERKHDPV